MQVTLNPFTKFTFVVHKFETPEAYKSKINLVNSSLLPRSENPKRIVDTLEVAILEVLVRPQIPGIQSNLTWLAAHLSYMKYSGRKSLYAIMHSCQGCVRFLDFHESQPELDGSSYYYRHLRLCILVFACALPPPFY
jgi:hypothetical protein